MLCMSESYISSYDINMLEDKSFNYAVFIDRLFINIL